MKLLVVEDEPKLRKAIAEGLAKRGYTVDTATQGVEGELLARQNLYEAIVLDVMMPERDGYEMCRNLRAAQVQTPVIFLTAKDTLEEKVHGLDLGADDYLTKPFSLDELAARIRALQRRQPHVAQNILFMDGLVLDIASQKVTADGKEIVLTLREYGLLEYLLRHQNTVVTREDILSNVWDRFYDSFSNVVDVHLKNLRKKLPKHYAKRLKTIWGKGYRLT